MTCRICSTRVGLAEDRFEVTDLYAYYRCEHCEHSFPVRWGDVPGPVKQAVRGPLPSAS